MKKHGLFILFIVLVNYGCTTSKITDTLNVQLSENRYPVVTVISINLQDRKFSNCLEKRLSEYIVDLKVVPEDEFRDALFPWFERNTAPKEISDLTDLLKNALVRRRIEGLNIDFLIYVRGHTTQSELDGPFIASAVGYLSAERETHMSIVVWDLEEACSVGDADIITEGRVSLIAIGIIFIPIPAFTETKACIETAKRIDSCITDKGLRTEK